LARKAIVYLRQSSDKQVRQNLESQRLQYEVAERIRGGMEACGDHRQ
jgi:DNA invertase Pin-like site-specific DNA recombinase